VGGDVDHVVHVGGGAVAGWTVAGGAGWTVAGGAVAFEGGVAEVEGGAAEVEGGAAEVGGGAGGPSWQRRVGGQVRPSHIGKNCLLERDVVV